MNALRQFTLRYLIADAAPLSARERWLSALAGLVGMLLMQAILAVVPVEPGISYLLAPLGASSVILFALPHSPLARLVAGRRTFHLGADRLFLWFVDYANVFGRWYCAGGGHLGDCLVALHSSAGRRHGCGFCAECPAASDFAANGTAKRRRCADGGPRRQ